MHHKLLISTILRDADFSTGVMTHVRQFRQFLSRAGHEWQMVTPYNCPKVVVYPVFAVRPMLMEPLNKPLSVWWYRQFHYQFVRRALAAEMRGGAPTIVYAQCPLTAKAAMEARQNDTQKVVMAVHFNFSQAEEWKVAGKIRKDDWVYRGIQRLDNETLPKVDGLIYVSDFMKRAVESRIPAVAEVRSAIVPNFIEDRNLERPSVPEADLVSIGSFEPRKNHQFLIRVLAAAKASGRCYSLSLIGDGRLMDEVRGLATSLGVADQVTFCGRMTNPVDLVAKHRAYVHAATLESFGLSLVEAMACGLPVFAAPKGGIPEVFSDRREGRYWDLQDPDEAAQILIETLEDEDAYRRVADGARARFIKEFEADRTAQNLLDFLTGVADSTGSCHAAA